MQTICYLDISYSHLIINGPILVTPGVLRELLREGNTLSSALSSKGKEQHVGRGEQMR